MSSSRAGPDPDRSRNRAVRRRLTQCGEASELSIFFGSTQPQPGIRSGATIRPLTVLTVLSRVSPTPWLQTSRPAGVVPPPPGSPSPLFPCCSYGNTPSRGMPVYKGRTKTEEKGEKRANLAKASRAAGIWDSADRRRILCNGASDDPISLAKGIVFQGWLKMPERSR